MRPALLLDVASRSAEHLGAAVQPDHAPGRTDRVSEEREVEPGAAADIQHGVALPKAQHPHALHTPDAVDRLSGEEVVDAGADAVRGAVGHRYSGFARSNLNRSPSFHA